MSKQKRTNILFIHYGDNWIRGSEVVLLYILKGIDKNIFSPFLMCNQSAMANEAEKLGVPTFLTSIPEIMIDKNYIKLQFIKLTKLVFKIIKLSKTHKIDLIYCNSGLPSQAGYYASKLLKIPMICHIHAPYTYRYIFLYRFYKAQKVIFVSKAIKEEITGKINFQNNGEVIYNGIDTNLFLPVEQKDPQLKLNLGIDLDTVVIGQVGSLIFRKGVDILLKAFERVNKRYPKTHLVFTSSGPDENTFVRLSRELGCKKNVTFTGYVDNVPNYYKHIFDINVLASRAEGLGISLIEGASCGLPCVGSNIPCIAEIIENNHSGLLFEKENIPMLAEKLELLIANPSLRKTMGARGREIVGEKFSIDTFTKRINDTLKNQVNLI